MICSPQVTQVIKEIRMIWEEHVALMGETELLTGFWWGNLKESGCFEDIGINGMIILKWILKK